LGDLPSQLHCDISWKDIPCQVVRRRSPLI
jgi:hypothetical protein